MKYLKMDSAFDKTFYIPEHRICAIRINEITGECIIMLKDELQKDGIDECHALKSELKFVDKIEGIEDEIHND